MTYRPHLPGSPLVAGTLGVRGLPLLILAHRSDLLLAVVAVEGLPRVVVLADLPPGGVGLDLLLLLGCRSARDARRAFARYRLARRSGSASTGGRTATRGLLAPEAQAQLAAGAASRGRRSRPARCPTRRRTRPEPLCPPLRVVGSQLGITALQRNQLRVLAVSGPADGSAGTHLAIIDPDRGPSPTHVSRSARRVPRNRCLRRTIHDATWTCADTVRRLCYPVWR